MFQKYMVLGFVVTNHLKKLEHHTHMKIGSSETYVALKQWDF